MVGHGCLKRHFSGGSPYAFTDYHEFMFASLAAIFAVLRNSLPQKSGLPPGATKDLNVLPFHVQIACFCRSFFQEKCGFMQREGLATFDQHLECLFPYSFCWGGFAVLTAKTSIDFSAAQERHGKYLISSDALKKNLERDRTWRHEI